MLNTCIIIWLKWFSGNHYISKQSTCHAISVTHINLFLLRSTGINLIPASFTLCKFLSDSHLNTHFPLSIWLPMVQRSLLQFFSMMILYMFEERPNIILGFLFRYCNIFLIESLYHAFPHIIPQVQKVSVELLFANPFKI